MYPLLFGVWPSYLAMWAVAAVIGLGGALLVARRHDFPVGRTFIAIGCALLSAVLGSKLLYLAESWVYPNEDYVPIAIRNAAHGFRIPGGVLLVAMTTVPVCRLLALDWRRFGDAMVPLFPLGLVCVRVGCFLNGCCFGMPTGSALGVTFPRGTWVHFFQRQNGWIAKTADQSLPVHPLQLYFAFAALAILIALLLVGRKNREKSLWTGERQFLFYFLFFATSLPLEWMRANPLTANRVLELGGLAIFGGLWAGTRMRPVAPTTASSALPAGRIMGPNPPRQAQL